MAMVRLIAAGALAACGMMAAGVIAGDARRGEQLFQTEQCIQCHSVNGHGGKAAPDLTRRVDRNYTPAVMASLMWNHAPDMWSAMSKQGIRKGQLSEESAADLFAYFVSARYFEQPGDAGRGKQAFAEKHCETCHGNSASGAPKLANGKDGYTDIVMVSALWNHGPRMSEMMKQQNKEWPRFTAQQMSDLIAYLNTL